MIALLFPGQGSQSVGMLSDNSLTVYAKTYCDKASRLLGYDVWDFIQNGPAEKLNQTEFTQPAMLVADIAHYAFWQSKNTEKPCFLAGHSLGEYAALVAADALTFEDAVTVVAARGKAMQEAVAPGQGAMAAIVGLSDDIVVEICAET